jgi:hypothetical protein
LKSKREHNARSRDTRAAYAPDIWPIIGLNRAVIVVGGEGGPRGDAIDSADDEFPSTWNDGGVASGSVVKRMPVDTARQINSVNEANVAAVTHPPHSFLLR